MVSFVTGHKVMDYYSSGGSRSGGDPCISPFPYGYKMADMTKLKMDPKTVTAPDQTNVQPENKL